MPIRNGIEFLPQSKSDITLNARPQDEILIVDDNSEDGTILFLKTWQKQDPRVRILTNPANNQGIANALNLGISESSHSLIGRFDVDDKYDRNRLKKQLTEQNKSNCVGVFSDYSFFSESKNYLGKMPSPIYPAPTSVSLLTNRRTPHSSALLLKSAIIESGGYRQQDFPAEDLSLWLRMSRSGDLISVPETLLNYRISTNSVSSLRQKEMISRRKALQKEIGINKRDLNFAVTNLKSILFSYTGQPDEDLRRILFLKDLADYYKMHASKRELLGFLSKILVEVPFNSHALRDYKKFYVETKNRQAARKSSF
jgi:glycosyltransferase involved in cell wall biosynthesis